MDTVPYFFPSYRKENTNTLFTRRESAYSRTEQQTLTRKYKRWTSFSKLTIVEEK